MHVVHVFTDHADEFLWIGGGCGLGALLALFLRAVFGSTQ